MIKKIYLFANKHPTAGLSFSTGEGVNKLWGFWSGGESGRFILRYLITKYGKSEGINIYNKYNEALLEVKESGMVGYDDNGNPRKIGCIVLYQNVPGEDDNNTPTKQGGVKKIS